VAGEFSTDDPKQFNGGRKSFVEQMEMEQLHDHSGKK
jgi:hypothetical protein